MMPAPIERHFPLVRCHFCGGEEFVVRDGEVVPCPCRPADNVDFPPDYVRERIMAAAAVTPQEERIPQPTEWDRRPDEGWGPIKVLALVVAILLVVVMVARFA